MSAVRVECYLEAIRWWRATDAEGSDDEPALFGPTVWEDLRRPMPGTAAQDENIELVRAALAGRSCAYFVVNLGENESAEAKAKEKAKEKAKARSDRGKHFVVVDPPGRRRRHL